MRSKWILATAVVLAALMALPARAVSVAERLNDARMLLGKGEAAKALEQYQNILVDAPESETAQFGIACAEYLQAKQQLGAGGQEKAKETFQKAREDFEKLAGTATADMRADALYNAANCVAQNAEMTIPPELPAKDKKAYQQCVDALRGAVTAYERMLEDYPDHEKARHNLDHVRYLLKIQLQNPPEEEKQSKMYSLINSAETQIPNMDVEVLPAPEDAQAGPDQKQPEGGNTAILKPKSNEGKTP